MAVPLLLTFGALAHADEWDKQTTVTINQPMEVPGAVLPAGTYVFRIANSPSDRHIVQVFNTKMNHLYTTVLAINNYRLEPTGKTVFTFYETPAGMPPAVRAWFYPGDLYGQEFIYGKKRMTELTAAKTTTTTMPAAAESQQQTAEVATTTAPEPAPAPVVEEQQNQNETQVAQNDVPQQPEVAPAPAPAPAPVMPQTGSELPLLALIGFATIASAAGIGAYAKRTN
jgi:LPXTG-motif cell wall-anchored protein